MPTSSQLLYSCALILAVFALPHAAAEPAEGKVAFITGASSGVGLQVSKDLAAAGMKVVLAARRKAMLDEAVSEIKAKGGVAAAIECDVASDASVAAALKQAADMFGGVDLVFANAGVEGDTNTPIEEFTQFDYVFSVNVVGTLNTLKHATPLLRKRGGGDFVITSSIASLINRGTMAAIRAGGMETASALIPYCSSKAALDSIAILAAGALEQDNIRVYALNLAVYRSEMQARSSESLGGEEAHAQFNPYFKGILGDPHYVSAVLLAFADGSSEWPSGSCLILDGDATFDADAYLKVRQHPDRFPDMLDPMGLLTPAAVKPLLKDAAGKPYTFKDEL